MTKHNSIQKNQLVLYFVLTFIISWLLWTPFVLAGIGVITLSETWLSARMLFIILGAFAPLTSALILKYREGKGAAIKQFLKSKFDFKVAKKYYLLALLIPLLITVFAHYFTNFTNIDQLPSNLFPEDLNFSPYLLLIPYFLLMLILGGGQEEFGWRGYAQDPLQDQYGVIKGSMLLGLIWGLWHLPLWFMSGEGHEYYPFIAFVLLTISFSVIIGILYNASGKKMVVPWIMHAMSNTSVPLFPVMFLADVKQPGYWVWVITNIVVAIGLTIWFQRKNILLNDMKKTTS